VTDYETHLPRLGFFLPPIVGARFFLLVELEFEGSWVGDDSCAGRLGSEGKARSRCPYDDERFKFHTCKRMEQLLLTDVEAWSTLDFRNDLRCLESAFIPIGGFPEGPRMASSCCMTM
jgi:hypothetical protein